MTDREPKPTSVDDEAYANADAKADADTIVPTDAPSNCPVCGRVYDVVTRHRSGLMVSLRENERYERVCFEPVSVDGEARLDFYHHTRPEQ